MITYTVKAGDTLGTIARQYLGNSLRYAELAKFNKLPNANLIYIGQVIKIPEASDLTPINVTAQKLPEPFTPADPNAPLPGVYELEQIEGSAPRDWIIPVLAGVAIFWAMSGRRI